MGCQTRRVLDFWLETVKRSSAGYKLSVDIGLAVLSAYNEETGEPVTAPGQTRSLREIAHYCDCTWQSIWRIEQVGLRKLRNRLYFLKDPALIEAMEQVIGRKPTL